MRDSRRLVERGTLKDERGAVDNLENTEEFPWNILSQSLHWCIFQYKA